MQPIANHTGICRLARVRDRLRLCVIGAPAPFFPNARNVRIYTERIRLSNLRDLRKACSLSMDWLCAQRNVVLCHALEGGGTLGLGETELVRSTISYPPHKPAEAVAAAVTPLQRWILSLWIPAIDAPRLFLSRVDRRAH